MSVEHIIRAWRDEEYRESLDAEQCEILPQSPAGSIDLSENELFEAQGGSETFVACTIIASIIAATLSLAFC